MSSSYAWDAGIPFGQIDCTPSKRNKYDFNYIINGKAKLYEDGTVADLKKSIPAKVLIYYENKIADSDLRLSELNKDLISIYLRCSHPKCLFSIVPDDESNRFDLGIDHTFLFNWTREHHPECLEHFVKMKFRLNYFYNLIMHGNYPEILPLVIDYLDDKTLFNLFIDNANLIHHLPKDSERGLLAALSARPEFLLILKNIPNQILNKAIKLNYNIYNYIESPTEEIQISLVTNWFDVLDIVSNPSNEVINQAIKYSPSNIKYVKNPSTAQCLLAIKYDPHVINLIEMSTELREIVETAFPEAEAVWLGMI